MSGAAPFRLSEYEGKKILKAFGWSVASAVVVLLLSLVDAVEVDPDYALIIPLVNAVLYGAKEWVSDNRDAE